MQAIRKFISISPYSILILTLLSIIAGLAKTITIMLLIPVMEILGISSDKNYVSSLYKSIINIFSLDFNIETLFITIILISLIAAFIIYISFYITKKIILSRLSFERKRYFESLTKVRWKNFNEIKVGQFVNAITDQAGKAFAAGFTDTVQLISHLVQAIIMIMVSLYISPIFTGLSILLSILLFFAFSFFDKPIKKNSENLKENTKQYTVRITETFNIIKSLLVMNKIKMWRERVDYDLNELINSTFKLFAISQIPIQLREPLVITIITLLTYIVIQFNIIEFSVAVALIILFQRVSSYVGSSQNLYQSILKMEPYYDDFRNSFKMLKKNEDLWKNQNEIKFNHEICFKDVNFKFGKQSILENFSLTIVKGNTLLIKGKSGIGKTTIIDLLVGLHKPNSGVINIDGVNLNKVSIDKWRNKIAYLPQEPELFNSTIENNIKFFDQNYQDEMINKSIELTGVKSFSEKLNDGLQTLVGEAGKKMSGGQKQRIALSRIMDSNKSVIILDEPTSALDDESGNLILELIYKLKNEKKTIIIISHTSRFNEAADKILQL